MFSIAAILAKVLGGTLLEKVSDLATAWINKEISEEEFHAKLAQSFTEASADVEKQAFDAFKSSFKEFNATLRSTAIVQYCYAATVVVTLWTHFWFVWIQPVGVAYGVLPVASTGDLILQWNYLLLAGLFGLLPLVLKDPSKSTLQQGLDWFKKRFK